jgi:hypothetical protein
MGQPVVDGVNAIPLTTAPAGESRRRHNVEADMLLLAGSRASYRVYVVEAKKDADNPWYAAIEGLLQLQLFTKNLHAPCLFHRRAVALQLEHDLPQSLPASALVLAPESYYGLKNKRANAVEPTLELLGRMRQVLGVDARLAVWNSESRAIEALRQRDPTSRRGGEA